MPRPRSHARPSSGPAARAAARLTRHPKLLGLLTLAAGAFLLVVGFLATTGPPFQERYALRVTLPADTPVLRAGQAVRIGGRLAGLVADVEPDRRGAGGVTVTANITKPGFRPLPADTEAYVRVHSIVYETYLELRPGTSQRTLGHEDRLVARAGSGVDLLEVVDLFDARAREHLRTGVVGLGMGAAARGREVNAALADTPPLARDLAAQLGAVTAADGALEDVIAGAARTFAAARGTRPDDVSALVTGADRVLGVLARRDGPLRQALRLLPVVEQRVLNVGPRAEPLLDDVAGLSRELLPGARGLTDALPTVSRLLSRGGVLRTEVARIADAADPVLRAGRPVARDLYPTMTTLRPLNASLRTLLERVGPYRRQFRIPGVPGVEPGTGEIAQAGRRFIDATNDPYPHGLAPGAPAWRVLPVFTDRPCRNPFPDPGQADRDTVRDGRCRPGGAR
ncbi:MAG TPA: MlaD family protein [Baekduia sp.]|nr:MlaD family protein [Baekduia sp.]